MKSTTRVFALLLAFCLLLSAAPLTAFAAAEVVTVTFPAGDIVETYPVAGTAEIGTQTVAPDAGLLFTAPADGYYAISINYARFIVTNDLHDGTASEFKYATSFSEEPGVWGSISAYYFKAGETQMIGLIRSPYFIEPFVCTIEQLGVVTAIEPTAKASAYVLDETICYYEENASDIVKVALDFAITLSEWPTVLYKRASSAGLTVRGKLESGDVALTAAFDDAETAFTVHCVRFEEVFSSFAFPADYQPVIQVSYDGWDMRATMPAYIEVTFADGSKQTFDVAADGVAEIRTPDGLVFIATIGRDYARGEKSGNIWLSVAGRKCLSVPSDIKNIPLPENIRRYFYTLKDNLEWGMWFLLHSDENKITVLKGMFEAVRDETKLLFTALF